MKVWVVCFDYDYEGFDIVGIYTSKEQAEYISSKVGLWGERGEHDYTSVKEVELDRLLGEQGKFTLPCTAENKLCVGGRMCCQDHTMKQ